MECEVVSYEALGLVVEAAEHLDEPGVSAVGEGVRFVVYSQGLESRVVDDKGLDLEVFVYPGSF